MAKISSRYVLNEDGYGTLVAEGEKEKEKEDDSGYGGPGIPDPADKKGPVKWMFRTVNRNTKSKRNAKSKRNTKSKKA